MSLKEIVGLDGVELGADGKVRFPVSYTRPRMQHRELGCKTYLQGCTTSLQFCQCADRDRKSVTQQRPGRRSRSICISLLTLFLDDCAILIHEHTPTFQGGVMMVRLSVNWRCW